MKHKLICFDVDGTLVDNVESSWQLFHDCFNIDQEKRNEAKRMFFNKEISYKDWAVHDINLWKEKGVRKEDFFRAMESSGIKLMKGALETITELRKQGRKIAIISGSINLILEFVLPDYEVLFDDVFFSRIHFDSRGFIDKVEVTEFDMAGKADALNYIAKRENIKLEECVFIGDHHNDVEAAKEAGLAIAFDCKDPELKKVADIVVEKKDIREILNFIE